MIYVYQFSMMSKDISQGLTVWEMWFAHGFYSQLVQGYDMLNDAYYKDGQYFYEMYDPQCTYYCTV